MHAKSLSLILAVSLLLGGCVGTPPEDPGETTAGPDAVGNGGRNEPDVAVKFFPTEHRGRGGEPSIAVLSDGTLFTNAWDETLRSTDGGHTWETVLDIARDLPAGGGSVEYSGDPWLWADPVTDRIFTMHVMSPCTAFWWSDDKGDSWTENRAGCIIPYNDRAQLTSGPPGPDPNPLAGVAYPTVLYRCFNGPVSTFADLGTTTIGYEMVACGMSYDGAQTWPVERVLSTQVVDGKFGGCRYLHNPPAVSKDGLVAVAIGAPSCDGLEVHVSRDSGLTWDVIEGPRSSITSLTDNPSHPDLAWSEEGALFALWKASDNQRYAARADSLDGTWTEPFPVTSPEARSTDFQAMQVGAEGRLAVAYFGTRDSGEDPETVPAETRWHLFIALSENADSANPTFVHLQVTPDDDPVQIGCTNGSGALGDPSTCNNLGDFIGSDVTPDGRFLVSFTDGCGPGCFDLESSRDTHTVVASLEGWRLGP